MAKALYGHVGSAPDKRMLDEVTRLLGGVQQLGGLRGAGTIEPVRDERRHNVKEQSGDMTLEGFGDLVDGSQPHVIC